MPRTSSPKKNIPQIDSPPMVAVTWLDAVAETGWLEPKSPELHICVTVGFLVSETKEAICIASTWGVSPEGRDQQFNSRMHIPAAWIQNRKVLKP